VIYLICRALYPLQVQAKPRFAVMAVACYVSAIQTLVVKHFGSCSFIDHPVLSWHAKAWLQPVIAESLFAGSLRSAGA
jgi:hypothetical protein